VEKSDMAAETYYHNFIKRLPGGREGQQEWRAYCEQPPLQQIEEGLLVNEVAALLRERDVLDTFRRRDIDLVAGGPPCQGFSMAGRRDPSDARNLLPWQFLEVVEAVQPKAVIIENVVGIGQDFLKGGAQAPFAQLRIALEQTGPGYVAQPMRVNAMHFGVPQHRPRMLLVALRSDIAASGGLRAGLPLWKSSEMPVSSLAPCTTGREPITVDDALWDLTDAGYVHPCCEGRYLEPAGAYAHALRCNAAWLPPSLPEALPPSAPANHVLRGHTPDIVERFRLYQYLDAQGIPGNVLNIPADASLEAAERHELLRRATRNATFPAMAGTTLLARDQDELVALLTRRATKKHSQRPLRLHEPSPTVMSLPDDFVHPTSPRTLTVREMARIQSFPDSFEFRSKETTGSTRRRFEVPQYTQVGNAVPPMLAAAVGNIVARCCDSAAAPRNVAVRGEPSTNSRRNRHS
jgi:DNA (cytosine-5)-methyltransferase 1